MILICNPDSKDETLQNLSLHVHKPCYHVTFAKKICASLELSPTKTWIHMLFDALYHLLCLSMLLKFWDQFFFVWYASCGQNATKNPDLLQVCCGHDFEQQFLLVFDLFLCKWLLGFRWPSCKWFLSTPGGSFAAGSCHFSVGKVLPNFREGFMIILFNKSPIPAIKRNIIFQTWLEGAILVPKNIVFHFWSDSFSTKMSVLPLCNNSLMPTSRPLTVKIAHGKFMISMCRTRFRADFEI